MSKQAATRRKTMYSGTHGNMASEVFKVVLTGDTAGTEIEMGVIPAGIEVTGLVANHDNLGAGTNVDIGYRYIDPDNGTDEVAYWGNHSTAAAGVKASVAKPVMFEDDVILVATLKGGAGTGELIIMPTGIVRGVK
ncbi:hypothetical protein [Marinobacterium iners]|uniref:DUF2190 family protein n=1 Tax=Marinobacterium iners DSM 11526 TaxID=1122198 RepID=A0A1H3X5W0_9GAMM|nr:hypothetical protein [Marinobacterium iners]SDZ94640.1 hypothetical protein SAMN02745729_10147 [Marinobacterium iners DSM 11526]